MIRLAEIDQHTPPCDRCGQKAHVDWVDISTFGDEETYVLPGRTVCETPGCVDERGSSAVRPTPTPAELERQAEREWFDRQRRLVEECDG